LSLHFNYRLGPDGDLNDKALTERLLTELFNTYSYGDQNKNFHFLCDSSNQAVYVTVLILCIPYTNPSLPDGIIREENFYSLVRLLLPLLDGTS